MHERKCRVKLASNLAGQQTLYDQVGKELNRVKPIEILRPCWRPWRGGILSLHKVVERLHSLIPATFEELDQVRPGMWRYGMRCWSTHCEAEAP